MTEQDEAERQFERFAQKSVNPEVLVKSKLHDGEDELKQGHFADSVVEWGVVLPVLVREEDGELAVVDGWKRVRAAREAGKEQVPVWIAPDGEWSDERAKLARLLANTNKHGKELDWLHRAWLIHDYHAEFGSTIKISPKEVSEWLHIAETTARNWIEPLRNQWNHTLIDREIYENGQVRTEYENDNEILLTVSLSEVIEVLNPRILRTIRNSTNHRKDRIDFLNGYVTGDISYEELKQTKKRVHEKGEVGPEALQKVRDTESYTICPEIEGETAERVEILSATKGVNVNEIVSTAIQGVLDDEGVDLPERSKSPSGEVGQFTYLKDHAEGVHPRVYLRMRNNRHLHSVVNEPIGLTVTSPPYNVLFDYGEEVNDSLDYADEYLPLTIGQTFASVHKVTLDGGYLCIVVPSMIDVSNPKMNISRGVSPADDIVKILTGKGYGKLPYLYFREKNRWELFQRITWVKPFNKAGLRTQNFPFPESTLNSFTETILVFKKPGNRNISRKSQSKIIQKNSVSDRDIRDNVWRISPESWSPEYTEEGATAQFPEELARRLILHYSYVGDTVLDPFCGRGTTLKMAKKLYRHSIGFEIQESLEKDIREYIRLPLSTG